MCASQCVRWIRVGGHVSGGYTEKHPGQKRHSKSESENWQRRHGADGNRVILEGKIENKSGSAECKEDAYCPADQREQHTFCKRLPDLTGARCPQGRPHGCLP